MPLSPHGPRFRDGGRSFGGLGRPGRGSDLSKFSSGIWFVCGFLIPQVFAEIFDSSDGRFSNHSETST